MGFYRVSDVKNGEKKSFFVPCCLVPRFPPAPSPPRGVKGSWNTQFGFFGLDRGVDSGRCGAGLFAQIGKRCGRSRWIGLFPCGTSLFPRFPPAPSPPRGVKGSLNTQFGFFGPDRGFDSGRYGAGLFAQIGERRSRSQWMGAWRGCESGATSTSGRGCGGARARSALTSVCEVSAANEHTRAPQAIGRAEQRSGGRIRAGACLSVASLRPTPGDASSARNPEGARPLVRLFFGYFLLAKQKKVTRPTGRNRYSKTCLSFAYFSLAKQRKVRPAAGQIYAQKNLFFAYFLLAKQKKVTRPTGRNLT